MAAPNDMEGPLRMSDQWDTEDFSKMQDDHVSILSVCLGLSIIALLATCFMARSSGRGVRLHYLVTAVVGVAIVSVGMMTWVVTYGAASDAILDKSQRMLKATAYVIEGVSSELESGADIVKTMAMAHSSMVVDWTAPYPVPQRGLRAINNALRRQSVSFVYLGTSDGKLQGAHSQYVTVGVDSNSPPIIAAGGCPHIACLPYDLADPAACSRVNASAACGDGNNTDYCAATCAAPPANQWCYPPAEVGPASMFMSTEWTNDYTPHCMALVMQPFDVRTRPWYDTNATTVSWSMPYIFFDSKAVGFTVTQAFYPSGTSADTIPRVAPAGVLAVDYSLSSLQALLDELLPTKNSAIVMVTPDGLLLASSMPTEAVLQDTGFDDSTVIDVNKALPSSKIRRAVNVAADRYGGSLASVMGRRALLVDGSILEAVTSVQVTGGLDVVILLTLPYADLLGETNKVSTAVLLITVGICIFFTIALAIMLHLTLRPLEDLAAGMDQVAWMNLSDVNVVRHSRVYELQWMERSFQQMVRNLEEFRQYLPASVLDQSSTDGTSEDDEVFVTTEGHAALVFTDVVKSSDSWEKRPAGMRVGLKRHNEIMRRALAAQNGYEVKTVGDSFMVAFEGEGGGLRAVKFALAVQELLRDADWPEDLLELPQNARTADGAWNGIRVRIGVHVGPVDIEMHNETQRKDYFGPTVNKASRMESNGIAGGVCVTDEVLAEVAGVMCSDLRDHSVMPMGHVDLKGIGKTMCNLLVSPSLENRRDSYATFIAQKAATAYASPAKEQKILAGRTMALSESGASQHTVRQAAGAERFTSRLDRLPGIVAGMVELRVPNGFLDDWTDPLGPINEAMSTIFMLLKRTSGNVTSVVGSGIATTWGAVKRDSTAKAFSNAFKFGRHLQVLHSNEKTAHPYFGMCVGPVVHGNIGVGQKFVTAIGPAVSLATHLAQVAVGQQTEFVGASLVGDFTSLVRGGEQGSIRPIDIWTIDVPRHSFTVFEVSPRRKGWCEGSMLSARKLSVDIRSDAARSPATQTSPGPVPRDLRRGSTKTMPHSGGSIDESIDNTDAAFTSWGWSAAYNDAFNAKDYDAIRENCHPDYDQVGFGVGERAGRTLRETFHELEL